MADNSRMLRRLFDERVRDLGLTAAQARLLLSLDRQNGENQAFYADKLEVEPITLTRIVDRMEESGWLERWPDPQDRRARRLHLTAKSKGVVAELRGITESMFEQMLNGLDSNAREQLAGMLDRIGENLSAARDKELTFG